MLLGYVTEEIDYLEMGPIKVVQFLEYLPAEYQYFVWK